MRMIAATLIAASAAAALVAAAPDETGRKQDSSNVTLHFTGAAVHTLDLRTISGTIRVTADSARLRTGCCRTRSPRPGQPARAGAFPGADGRGFSDR